MTCDLVGLKLDRKQPTQNALSFSESMPRPHFPHARRVFNTSYSQGAEDWALYEQFHSLWPEGYRGTFVEIGALDGWSHSNSLAFERWLRWRGVLVEANPDSCALLFQQRANGATTNLCTAISRSGRVDFRRGPYAAVFAAADTMSESFRARWHGQDASHSAEVVAPGMSLGRLLRMAGVASIDVFFLDVEGSEPVALETFDWAIPVAVWCVELQRETANETVGAMRRHGYQPVPWAREVVGYVRSHTRRDLLRSSQLFVRRGSMGSGRSAGRSAVSVSDSGLLPAAGLPWTVESPFTPPSAWAQAQAERIRAARSARADRDAEMYPTA